MVLKQLDDLQDSLKDEHSGPIDEKRRWLDSLFMDRDRVQEYVV